MTAQVIPFRRPGDRPAARVDEADALSPAEQVSAAAGDAIALLVRYAGHPATGHAAERMVDALTALTHDLAAAARPRPVTGR